ncbi:3',5'-cyclic-nucleotide phosphodiesterase [Mortierella alpina]|nr:3',5'-cyclic-nucleotide phosphodiesterase [Mortierella alpina]
MMLLVDVDTDLELTPVHPTGSYPGRHHRPATSKSNHARSGGQTEGPDRNALGAEQRHSRATSDSSMSKGASHKGRRTHNRVPELGCHDGALCGQDFLESVLQGIAKGSLHHVVPIAMSSATSQDRLLELFNLGVADVLLKPVEEQVARTLFLNVHRYNKYRTAVTIPRYATQKNALALPSHARLRNVFLKDQWLSDILIHHYCPTPTRISLKDFPSMSSYAAKERVDQLKDRLLSWDFHPHDLCQDDLMRCVVIVMEEVMKLDGLGDLNIPEHLLHRFVIGLRDSYHRSNPYHNFAHAVDVLQATFYFLCRMGKLPQSGYGFPPIPDANGEVNGSDNTSNNRILTPTEESDQSESLANIPTDDHTSALAEEDIVQPPVRIQDFLRPEDIFALVVASIGHDVGHPGVNNMFLVNAHTPLAQVYNDRSVLESFHSMALFQVMKKHGFECFDVDSQNRKFMEFRKMVVSTILATDMGLHFDYVGKIKEQTERLQHRNMPGGNVPKPNQASIDEQERLVLCGTLIKCADISNASRPFHVAERWSAVLLQEMCNQADIEKEMAVCSGSQSVPAGSTKSLANDRGMQIDSQLGFIHGFAMPLFSSVKEMIPEMEYCVDLLQINHKIWQDRKTEYIKNGGANMPSPLNSIRSGVDEEDRSQKEAASTQSKRLGNHTRIKSLAGKGAQQQPTGRDGSRQASKKSSSLSSTAVEGDATAVPIKLVTGSVRRSPNGNHASASNDQVAANSSSIPRPRTRTKAMTSEGNIIPESYGQESRQPGGQQQQQHPQQRVNSSQQGSHRQRPSNARDSNSRVRTVTSTSSAHPSSVPAGSGGLKSTHSNDKPAANQHQRAPSQEQSSQFSQAAQPKQSSRGQRSPGRRTHQAQPLAKQEKTIMLSYNGGISGSPLDPSEPIVLGSLLPVTPPALMTASMDQSASSEVSTSMPSSPSQSKSSPSTPPPIVGHTSSGASENGPPASTSPQSTATTV